MQTEPLRRPGRAEVAPGVARLRCAIVNVYFLGEPGGPWILVDTGLPGFARLIRKAAETRFGQGARPEAIVLTHGHFDHVGSLEALLRVWDVPVYAHERELPFLTGAASYPPPDPWVGGGMALSSPLFPRSPLHLGARVRALHADFSLPALPEWRWIHTPGHSAGHVSLFRDSDRVLVAGDAFVTTRQESLLSALLQRRKLSGPPAYFTPNWTDARASVERLAALEPEVAATGHGVPMRGRRLQRGLKKLAKSFERRAVPRGGRYVGHAAYTDAEARQVAPPTPPRPRALSGLVATLLALWWLRRRRVRAHQQELHFG
ncbi:glyoxylase-like metal-dependent hydrolase (beta-lactamase superfamily II) [Deinobacterium chartae]|uniref:Glyoxylase-like metal-dependent hydrolase (Beta-lactamase superfamily II) n=1 Tax=Deinobacterium chartae TaxID=521158 RepID=A0A841HZ25_9DEIO|nr:MBL fold metallo-hydrolase [Deinobacterium chartae]MBB6098126.1 glyoxylase-like metal-dependent hydrolase (beta-lactamase superfamily II) [Deinobacterium chartae]